MPWKKSKARASCTPVMTNLLLKMLGNVIGRKAKLIFSKIHNEVAKESIYPQQHKAMDGPITTLAKADQRLVTENFQKNHEKELHADWELLAS